jgi:amidase
MKNEDSLPLEFRSATTLLALLRARRLGALELLDAQLARIERTNPALNAVVALDVDRARAAARAADSAPADARGPLHGLSMTIKDAYEVAGMTATCGFPHLAKHLPVRDADAVAR